MAEYLTTCKVCGQQVSSKAKICTHCGKRLKMALWLKIVIGIVILMGVSNAMAQRNSGTSSSTSVSTGNTPTATNSSVSVDLRPEEQQNFEILITTYSRRFDEAQNELQESTFRKERMNAIKDLDINPQINNWVGTLGRLGTNSEGKAHITIKLNNHLTISTWNNAFSDFSDNTLIQMDSDLYKTLYNMRNGQKVRFSGFFIQSSDDYFREKSLTIRGTMKTPDFLMRFSDIEAIN
jgi:RNA polymerase subunit RPABC4/transcription elongation factor Spt4